MFYLAVFLTTIATLNSQVGARTITTTITTSVVYDISTNTNVPLTTLCDGRPRALESYTTYYLTSTETYDPPLTTSYVPYSYTEDPPSCTIAETACTPILSSYSSAVSSWDASGGTFPDAPHCTTSETFVPTPTEPDYVPCGTSVDYCRIHGGGDYKLYYWPVTTTGGDFCAQNGTTVTPAPTDPAGSPNTAIIDGTTLTSPTNYISFGYAQAFIHGRRPSITSCGAEPRESHTHENFILPITAPFSSVRGINGIRGTYSFNFADLNTPVPTSAWDGQRKCGSSGNRCSTIEGSFTPIIPPPTEVVNLEPAWVTAGCVGTAEGYYMTPVAL